MSMVCLRLTVFSEESVPLFGPPLPVPPVFVDLEEFRDFLLVKSKSSAGVCCLCVQRTSCVSTVSRQLVPVVCLYYGRPVCRQ